MWPKNPELKLDFPLEIVRFFADLPKIPQFLREAAAGLWWAGFGAGAVAGFLAAILLLIAILYIERNRRS